jgi:hypothetical protein
LKYLKRNDIMNFIEYLIEQKFTDTDGKVKFLIPKNVITGNNIKEIVECLKETLKTLKTKPNLFTISSRDVNAITIKKILKIENDTRKDKAFCNDVGIKKQVIDKILDIPLERYFNKSAHSDNGFGGWIYAFVVPKYFETYQKFRGPRSNKLCIGDMLYLKFNFKTYVDADRNIKIDPETIELDIVSMHPTNSTK